MLDEIIQSLLDYAWDNQIGFTLTTHMDSHADSVSFAKYRSMIINLNYWRPNEIPLIIAHEISHILNDDTPEGYYSGLNTYNLKREKLADIRAVHILVPIYINKLDEGYDINNVMPLMEQLCIPIALLSEVKSIVSRYVW